MLLSNVFNVRFNVKKKHNIHISSPVFNIRFIKVLYVSLHSNNKINTPGLFVKVIKRLKNAER